jgi:UDP-N-acetylglucosamine--N-acetylmuramyl-(pentapeptide) pyrophosphoryl-undecaprenol N-acetylglucosamine transferase
VEEPVHAGFDQLAPRFQASGLNGQIAPFFTDMPRLFSEADLVVSRAGMGSVSEIAAAGKPSILVPLATSADQHQLRNAEALQQAGAAKLVLDAEMTGARLVEEAGRLATEPLLLEKMGEAARSFAHPGAARRAAEILEGFQH